MTGASAILQHPKIKIPKIFNNNLVYIELGHDTITHRPDNSSLNNSMATLSHFDTTLGTTLYTISAPIDIKKVWPL